MHNWKKETLTIALKFNRRVVTIWKTRIFDPYTKTNKSNISMKDLLLRIHVNLPVFTGAEVKEILLTSAIHPFSLVTESYSLVLGLTFKNAAK